KFLCLLDIADLGKRIIIHTVGNVVCIKNIFHHFPSVDINLDLERKPCLEFYMHKSKSLIHEIKVIILTFTVYRIQKKFAVLFLPRLKSLTVFHNRKDAYQPLINRRGFHDFKSSLLFGSFGRSKITKRTA